MQRRIPLFALLSTFPVVAAAQPAGSTHVRVDDHEPAHSAVQSLELRDRALKEAGTLSGSTGLLRTVAARSTAEGIFRAGAFTHWYTGTSFLCSASAPCAQGAKDDASRFGTTLALSVSPLAMLEGYAALSSSLSSNSAGSPEQQHTLGDTVLGLKAFSPEPLLRVLRFGGAAEMLLLGGTRGVGFDWAATGARLRAIGSADLNELESRVPLRLHANLGYWLDNSSKLAESAEAESGRRLARTERFGAGINRVDRVQSSLGAEATFTVARPFIEYELGLPISRQDYGCAGERSGMGEACLEDRGLAAYPSLLTLGVRFHPWLKGLQATAALDAGVTGTSVFVEELAPVASLRTACSAMTPVGS